MRLSVCNIEYKIDIEDVIDMFNEDDFASRSDLIEACEDKIEEIIESLPTEMDVSIDVQNKNDEEEIDDSILDAISNQTGWLVKSFSFKRIKN